MMTTEKKRERKLRLALARDGYALHKSRCKTLKDFGGYMVVLTKYNAVVVGARFEYTLDDVESWWNSLNEEA